MIGRSNARPYRYTSDQVNDATLSELAAEKMVTDEAVVSHSFNPPASPTFTRFTELPKDAQSLVPRFLDVLSLRSLRLSGKDGAAFCKSWWVGTARDLPLVLDKFKQQRIEGITLAWNEFSDVHMQMLPTTLRRLTLLNQTVRSQISSAGFARLHDMRLQHLDVRGFGGMNDACMAHLRGVPLEEIYLPLRNAVTDSGIENLRGAPLRIANLCLTRRITDGGVAHLSLCLMEKLNLQGCRKITDITLARVAQSNVRQLEVDFCSAITNDGITFLRSSAVQSLGIAGCTKLTAACFDDLCAMRELQRLRIWSCPLISDEEMDALKKRLRQKNPLLDVDWGFT